MDSEWGVQQGALNLEDSMPDFTGNSEQYNKYENIVFGDNIGFPLELIYQVLFIGGKRGSGKSYTAGVMMEEFNRLGLQFVCFDALDAHGYIAELNGVEAISPTKSETINMRKLVEKLIKGNSSLIVNMEGLPLETQQKLVADYCETLLEMGAADDSPKRGLMNVFEECQDFVPQMGRPESFSPIVRLCKLGRSKGYGVTLISQRPAAVSKEALSQASIYAVHNIINTKDLGALKEQLSFGTDKKTIDKILSGITFAEPGDLVCYAPEYFKDEGYVKIGRVNTPRRSEHKGANIQIVTNTDMNSETSFTSFGDVSNDFNLEDDDVGIKHDMFAFKMDDDDDDDLESEALDFEIPSSKYEWVPDDSDLIDLNPAKTSDNNLGKGLMAASLIASGIYLMTRFSVKKD